MNLAHQRRQALLDAAAHRRDQFEGPFRPGQVIVAKLGQVSPCRDSRLTSAFRKFLQRRRPTAPMDLDRCRRSSIETSRKRRHSVGKGEGNGSATHSDGFDGSADALLQEELDLFVWVRTKRLDEGGVAVQPNLFPTIRSSFQRETLPN